MIADEAFEPTPQAAWRRLQAVRPAAYAQTRNHLQGAVTRLSPYLTHGLLTLAQVVQHLPATHGLPARHRLMAELGWRAWFRHRWQHEGEAILRSLHAGPLPDAAYATAVPADVREARTGLAVIDRSVQALHAQGWLHNHARLWLASYLVHGRRVHWRAGADWMLAHLLDGDLASNHLSWQWVAGTGSHRPYLFNADNVARFAPGPWWVGGTVLDRPYEALEAIACGDTPLPAGPAQTTGEPEPAVHVAPPAAGFTPARAADVAGRDVWLVHPWSLADPPPGRLPVALCDAGFHRRWPWSERRWRFVTARQQAVAAVCWFDEAPALQAALAAARSVQGLHDPHLGPELQALCRQHAAPAFSDPGRRCRSFSDWWSRVQPVAG